MDKELLKDNSEKMSLTSGQIRESLEILRPIYNKLNVDDKDSLIKFLIYYLAPKYHENDIIVLISALNNNYADYIKSYYKNPEKVPCDIEEILSKSEISTTERVDIQVKLYSIFNPKTDAEKEENELNETIKRGEIEFNNLKMPLSEQLKEVFEILMPGNGEIGAMLWANAIATVKGKPNTVILVGNPGEGKTVLMDYIIDFIPPKRVIKMNNLTESGLFQSTKMKGVDYLDKKIVYLGDLGDKNGFEKTLPARKILRTLQTDGYYARTYSERVKGNDGAKNWDSQEQILTGKPAMWFNTVREDADAQDIDRSIICTTNLEKARDIKRIIQHIGNPDSKTGKKIRNTINHWRPILHVIFEYLVSKDIKVIIPWDLSELNYKFRDLKRIITLTEQLAFINSNYHDKYNDYILAMKSDVSTVTRFLNDGSGDLSAVTMKRLNMLYEKYGKSGDFTRMDAVSNFPDTYSADNTGKANINRDVLKPAITAGILEEDKDGHQYIYCFLDKPVKKIFKFELPEINWEMIKNEYGEDANYTPHAPSHKDVIKTVDDSELESLNYDF